jgi:hypothetical protein
VEVFALLRAWTIIGMAPVPWPPRRTTLRESGSWLTAGQRAQGEGDGS